MEPTNPQENGKVKKVIKKALLIYGGGLLVLVVLVLVAANFMPSSPDSDKENQFTKLFNPQSYKAEFSGELIPDWAPTIGSADAKVTIVEFSDFECPFCKASFPIIQNLAREFPDNVRLVYRHFPLSSIHPLAKDLAHASMCAHDQGKFWVFHDQLFIQQGSITRGGLDDIAISVGLDLRTFRQCQDSGRFKDEVDQDFEDAVALGGRGTPTWIVNGKKLEGVLPLSLWRKIVEDLL